MTKQAWVIQKLLASRIWALNFNLLDQLTKIGINVYKWNGPLITEATLSIAFFDAVNANYVVKALAALLWLLDTQGNYQAEADATLGSLSNLIHELLVVLIVPKRDHTIYVKV